MPHIYDKLISHPITDEWEIAIDKLAKVQYFDENTKFLRAVADLENSDPEDLDKKIQDIITNFLRDDSPLELNLPSKKELDESKEIIFSNATNSEKIDALKPIVNFVEKFVRTHIENEIKKIDQLHASLLADKFFSEVPTSNTKPEDFERALLKNIDEQTLSDRGKSIFLSMILNKLSNDKNASASLIVAVLKTGEEQIESKQERKQFIDEAAKNLNIKEKTQVYLLNITKRLTETLVQTLKNNPKVEMHLQNAIHKLDKNIDIIHKEIRLYSLQKTLKAIAKLKKRRGSIVKLIKLAQEKIKPESPMSSQDIQDKQDIKPDSFRPQYKGRG